MGGKEARRGGKGTGGMKGREIEGGRDEGKESNLCSKTSYHIISYHTFISQKLLPNIST
jgi:hypothetical protein